MAELAAILAEGNPFDVEAIRDLTAWTHVVSYEDVMAHEFEDSVSRSVEFLSSMYGVLKVEHEDRERVLIEAPGLGEGDFAEQLRRFWHAEVTRRQSSARELEAIAVAVAEVLKEAGFRKRKATWNRDGEDGIVHVLELDTFDRGQGRHAVLSLGVFVPVMSTTRYGRERPDWVGEHDCSLRVSSKTLQSPESPGAWPLGEGLMPVVTFLREVALPFLDARQGLEGVIDGDATAPPGAELHQVNAAIGLVSLGRREEAQRRLEEGFAAYPHAHHHFSEVAAKLDLTPPDTTPATDEPDAEMDEPAARRPEPWWRRWMRRTLGS